MDLFGSTRSSVRRSHALIAPDGFVRSELLGWELTQGIILISPRLGARFVQYLALMERGGNAGPAPPGVERVLYVLEGELAVTLPGAGTCTLVAGGFAFCPPDSPAVVRARAPSRLNVFEKRYIARPGVPLPESLYGDEREVAGAPFLGDPGTDLKTLLPNDARFDLAVNVLTFQPGAALPLVEVHVMEHGLLMLEGQGIYRLADDWYPVRQGDVIWMAPFCPQWFVAMGKTPARYLYYKDVNRDPLEMEKR
jgi:(S)-ureidoglycine aminohydrolase